MRTNKMGQPSMKDVKAIMIIMGQTSIKRRISKISNNKISRDLIHAAHLRCQKADKTSDKDRSSLRHL